MSAGTRAPASPRCALCRPHRLEDSAYKARGCGVQASYHPQSTLSQQDHEHGWGARRTAGSHLATLVSLYHKHSVLKWNGCICSVSSEICAGGLHSTGSPPCRACTGSLSAVAVSDQLHCLPTHLSTSIWCPSGNLGRSHFRCDPQSCLWAVGRWS